MYKYYYIKLFVLMVLVGLVFGCRSAKIPEEYFILMSEKEYRIIDGHGLKYYKLNTTNFNVPDSCQ